MANQLMPADRLPVELIEQRIYLIRGQRVMLDWDLARLYQVTTKRLNEQVKRNLSRFPDDFMFRLTTEESASLNRSQIATGSSKAPRSPSYPLRVYRAWRGHAVLSPQ